MVLMTLICLQERSMARLVRKITIGKDYKDAMHYSVGQKVYGGHLITNIVATDDGYCVWIKKGDDIYPWKHFNNNMGISVEFNLDY